MCLKKNVGVLTTVRQVNGVAARPGLGQKGMEVCILTNHFKVRIMCYLCSARRTRCSWQWKHHL